MRALLALLILAAPAGAFEMKLDESWLAKLNELCVAAQYGSRMTADPICAELLALAKKAAAEDIKAREDAKPKADGQP